MDVPLEILFLIFRNFRGDPRTLKTLALVSRPFLLIARTFLFSSIRLNSLNPRFSKHASRMVSLLSRNRELLASIRELELGPAVLRMGRDPVSAFHTEHWAAVHGKRLPSIHDPRAQFIMENAIGVRSLTLRFEFQDWNNFSPSFQNAVSRIVTQESLVTLRIEDAINFPLHIVAKSSSIKHLYLGFVAQHPTTSDDLRHPDPTSPSFYHTHITPFPSKSSSPYSPSRIVSLTLFESDDCVPNLVEHFDLSNLRRLSINVSGFDGRAALKRIPELAQNIHTLELRVCNQRLTTLSLPPFHNVRTLLLNIPVPYRTTFEDIHALISPPASSHQAPSLPNLTDLKVFFRKLKGQEMWRFMLSPILDSAWALLDPEYAPHPSLEQTAWVVTSRQVDVLKQAEEHVIDRLLDTPWSEMRGRVIEVAEDRFEPYSPVYF